MHPNFRAPLRALILAVALCGATAVALAQAPYVDIEQRLSAEQLREVGLTPAQLAKLNAMLREAQAHEATTMTASPAVAAADNDTAVPATDEPASSHRGMTQFIGLDDEPIESRVVGTVAGWQPGTVFVLENGQQWKVLKGEMTLRKARENPEIVVIPGVAGRWFLQVDEDMPKARVYRID